MMWIYLANRQIWGEFPFLRCLCQRAPSKLPQYLFSLLFAVYDKRYIVTVYYHIRAYKLHPIMLI